MKKLLFVFLMLVFASTSWATPYALDFNADGIDDLDVSNVVDEVTIYGWDLEAVAVNNIPTSAGGTGAPIDMVTYQDLGSDNILNNGDTFTEDLRVQVLNGLGAPNTYNALPASGVWSALASDLLGNQMAALYADFNLNGYISDYDNGGDGNTTLATLATNFFNDSYVANFSTGSGTMWADLDDDGVFDVGEDIAGFTLLAGDEFTMDPNVFSQFGSSDIELSFQFDYADSAYFQTADGFADIQDLIAQEWLLTFAQGSIALLEGEIGAYPDPNGTQLAPNDQILLGFQETGLDAKFTVVPEPSTYILLGVGIAGLAFYRRKKN